MRKILTTVAAVVISLGVASPAQATTGTATYDWNGLYQGLSIPVKDDGIWYSMTDGGYRSGTTSFQTKPGRCVVWKLSAGASERKTCNSGSSTIYTSVTGYHIVLVNSY